MSISKIEWTEVTWNPVTGCDKVSPGCKNCYAERMAFRLKAMGNKNYKNGFKLTMHENLISLPYSWKKPKIIFVNSMSDLFHEDIPFQFIEKVFQVMADNSHHTFQILTKRSGRLAEIAKYLTWTPNIWMGVTVENIAFTYRIDHLKKIPSAVRFLSCEPLLSSLGPLDLKKIQWVIVGGESGPGARPMEKNWVIEIRNQCQMQNIPFFFKQWGGVNKKKSGRLLDGLTWQETPLVTA